MENGSSPGNNGSRPKSMAVVDNGWESQGANLVQATHAYLSSGDNQLSFHEGDTIAISGKCNVEKLVFCRLLIMSRCTFQENGTKDGNLERIYVLSAVVGSR